MIISRAIAILIAGLLLSITVCAAESEPIFAGVWSQKEAHGVGGMFIGQNWDHLVSRWKELGANQYLADVEVYRHNGQWRYTGLWRIGPGNGALYLLGWDEFEKKWKELKETQDLLDVEIFHTDSGWRYLGVWRHKQGRNRGDGAFLVGLTWDELVAQWKKLGEDQYLSDVETYVSNGQRLFAGVWRIGSGNGALYWLKDWQQFAELKRSLNATQEMLDFEMFQTDDEQWNFLGVWRQSAKAAGPLHASQSSKSFQPLTMDQFLDQWEKLKPTHTLINIAIVVPSIAVPPLILRGDTNCKYGDIDCNRCATDVPTQFRLAFETGHRPWIGWKNGSWKFSGSVQYPPDNMKPEDAFNPFEVGITSKHIQGLVRTNSSRYPYAGSHSHKDKGSIFFVGVDEDGDKRLSSLHKASNDHPSGVHVLGDDLFVAESGFLRWFSISAARDNQNNKYEIPKSLDPRHRGLEGAGGGLGLAKLQDGTYLLVVSAPGDGFRLGTTIDGLKENQEPKYTRFYRLLNRHPSRPDDIQFIGEYKHGHLSKYPKTPMAYSENLSLVTECGTGHLYTIHTTGQYLLNGDGYWRLSRVEGDPKNPHLQHIGMAKQSQDTGDCHHRSSATVHVNKSGDLEFLCTERTVLKRNPVGTFNFKEGVR